MIRLSRARLAQFIAALAVLISALTLTPASAQAAPVNGAVSNTVVTAASGPGPIYSWDQISVPAEWKVPVSTPAGLTSSLGSSVAQPESIRATLPLTKIVGGIVANCYPPPSKVSVGDFVWLDVNRDGLQSADEPGIANVTVNLFKDGKVVQNTTTNEKGYYGFAGLEPNTEYTVQFVWKGVYPKYTVTKENAGTKKNPGGDRSNSPTSDLTDSDAGANGLVTFTTPASGNNSVEPTKADNPGIDLGLVSQINLRLTKTIQTKGPVRNGAELTYALTPHNDGPVAALAGWSVTDLLPAGMTLDKISGDGYTCTKTASTKPVCVAGAGLGAGSDGSVITVVTKVTIDSGSLKNVAYVSPATGEVTETNPLVIPTLTTDTSTSATDNDAQASIDVASPVSVGDFVWLDVNRDGLQTTGEPGIADVTVKLLKDGMVIATTTTDAKGYYGFAGLLPSTKYTVQFVVPTGDTVTTKDAGGDWSNSPTSDLTDSDAGADGLVTFTTPADGQNSVAPMTADNPGIDLGLVSQINLTLTKTIQTTGPVRNGADLTYRLTPHNDGPVAALAGWSVTDVLPAGMTLVSISGDGYACNATTDPTKPVCVAGAGLRVGADGAVITAVTKVTSDYGNLKNVAFVSPAQGDVPETNPLVVPSLTTDTSTSATDNDAQASIDVASPVSVGDYVWWDVNRDGLQSAGEPGIPGVTVTLQASEGTVVATTQTDGGGYYAFPGLTPGQTYAVVFTPPKGAELTTQKAGSNDAIDSDAPASGKVTFTAPVTGANLTAPTSADLPTIDAGFVQLNFTLTRSVTSQGPYYGGTNVTYKLVPHNDGPVDALSGWSVTEVLPAGSTLVGLSGDGYTCYTNLVCVSSTTLAAGADGNPIRVVVQIPADLIGQFKNVAYVSPAETETAETNPLVVPTIETDTVATATDNDAEALIDVLPPQPEGIVITLPNTGTTIPLTWLLVAIGIVAAGVILLGASGFNPRGRKG